MPPPLPEPDSSSSSVRVQVSDAPSADATTVLDNDDDVNPFLAPVEPAEVHVIATTTEQEEDHSTALEAPAMPDASLAPTAAESAFPDELPPPPEIPPMSTEDASYLRITVLWLAAAMTLNFGMFAPVQNIVTTVFPGYGTASLVLLYASFTVSTIVAPVLVRKMGASNAVMIGCAGYCIYTMFCLVGNVVMFLLSSLIVGTCAGIIWTGNGVLLTLLSTAENRGVYSALILAGVRLSAVCANIVLGVFLHGSSDTELDTSSGGGSDDSAPKAAAPYNTSLMFFVFLLIGLSGFLGFIVLRIRMRTCQKILDSREKMKLEAFEAQRVEMLRMAAEVAGVAAAGEDGALELVHPTPLLVVHRASLRERMLEIFSLIPTEHFRFLFPVCLCQGFLISFFFGTYTVVMGTNFLGFAQAVMGVIAVTVITLFGRRLDRVPRSKTRKKKTFLYATLSMHLLLAFLAMVVAFLSDGYTSHAPQKDYPRVIGPTAFGILVYSSCLVMGFAWPGTDICLYYFVGSAYSTRSEGAFAAKAFTESLGFVLSQCLLAFMPPWLYCVAALIWTSATIFWLSKWNFPVELMHSKGVPEEHDPTVGSNLDDPNPKPAKWYK